MFQFRRFPTYAYLIQRTLIRYCRIGFPHSEILGLTLMCSSPRLIAACHVLHRLLMPRHSPCALYSLNNYSCFSNYAGISSRIRFPKLYLLPFHFQPASTGRNRFPQFFPSFPLCCLASSFLPLFSFPGANLRGFTIARMVEISGFEPLTPCLQSRCSPS